MNLPEANTNDKSNYSLPLKISLKNRITAQKIFITAAVEQYRMKENHIRTLLFAVKAQKCNLKNHSIPFLVKMTVLF